MAVSREFVDHVLELLDGFGPAEARRMFGGAGLFRDGVMFGLVADDVLYFKADAGAAALYEAEGCESFGYETKSGRRVIMSYRRVPDRLFDEPDEFAAWARRAWEAAFSGRKGAQG